MNIQTIALPQAAPQSMPAPTPLPPFVLFYGVHLEREPFRWRAPLRRRCYVLTYRAKREGRHAWETCISFYDTLQQAIEALPDRRHGQTPPPGDATR